MLNKIMLIGNVGKEPDVRSLDHDRKVANFSLATNEFYRDQRGEKQQQTEWHNIVVWNKLAEVVERYVKKGDRVYVEGKIRTRSYENKEGEKKYTTEILVNNLNMLGGNSGQSRESQSGNGQETHSGNSQVYAKDVVSENSEFQPQDDDLPF